MNERVEGGFAGLLMVIPTWKRNETKGANRLILGSPAPLGGGCRV